MNVYEQFRADHMDKRIGVTASCFDLMHAGHHLMLKEARELTGLLVVFLQTDPTVDRPEKNKPILSMDERRILVQGCKYVDHIFEYTSEAELLEGLRSLRPDLRILGNDYVGKTFTGSDLNIPVHFHDRSVHGWSTSELRRKIWEVEDDVRTKLDWKITQIKIDTAKRTRDITGCPLEPDVSSPEQFWKKLQSKFDQVLVDVEKDFRDEHGVDINAVIQKMKAQNRVATQKLQKAFETGVSLKPTTFVSTALDELHAQNPAVLDADIRKIEEDLQNKSAQHVRIREPSEKNWEKVRSKHEQGPHTSSPELKVSEPLNLDDLYSRIHQVEREITRCMLQSCTEYKKPGPCLTASNEAAADVEYWAKVRSQCENGGTQPTEGVQKNFELTDRHGLYPFECRMGGFGSEAFSEWRKSVARVHAKQEEWRVIDSLRHQFIAEWTAMFHEKNPEQGPSEFGNWWAANQIDLTRVFEQIAVEYVQGGGKAKDVSLYNYDLTKYGIADPI